MSVIEHLDSCRNFLFAVVKFSCDNPHLTIPQPIQIGRQNFLCESSPFYSQANAQLALMANSLQHFFVNRYCNSKVVLRSLLFVTFVYAWEICKTISISILHSFFPIGIVWQKVWFHTFVYYKVCRVTWSAVLSEQIKIPCVGIKVNWT